MFNPARIGSDFPIKKNWIYLNAAKISPYCRQVFKAFQDINRKRLEMADLWLDIEDQEAKVRRLFARLINAEEDEIALVANTTEGINIVANMIDWIPKDNIVTEDLAFPSNIYPWFRQGMDVRIAKNVDGVISTEAIESLTDANTKVITVSHVCNINGFRHNLGELATVAHDHGAFLLSDSIQALGALKVDVKKDDVDFLASSSHKWLLGPAGVGFFYIRRELITKFIPRFVGWRCFKKGYRQGNYDLSEIFADTARRFQGGTPNITGITGAIAALRYILDIGIENIEPYVIGLRDRLIEGLQELDVTLLTDPEWKSGICTFTANIQEAAFTKMCEEKHISVTFMSKTCEDKKLSIRASPHIYNSNEDIDKFVEAIAELI